MDASNLRRMRRMPLTLVLVLLASGVSARAGTPPLPVDDAVLLARAMGQQTSGPTTTLVTSEEDDARALPAGDLDGDGLSDVILVTTRHAPGGAKDLEVRALSSASGAELWGPRTAMLRRTTTVASTLPVTLVEGVVWVGASMRLDDDAAPDVLLASSNLNAATASVVALSGADGSELWRHDGPGVPGEVADAAIVGLTVPLYLPGDVTWDGLEDVLLGRFDALGPPGARTWNLRVAMVAGMDGRMLGEWRATGVGMAPTATVAWLDGANPDVLVGEVFPGERGRTVGVRRYARTVWGDPVWSLLGDGGGTSAPATAADVGITLQGLPGEGFWEGGYAVGFVGAGPADHRLRATLVGPTSLVGVGRGGIERFRIQLPSSAIIDEPGDLNGDGLGDYRSVRVDGDALLVESWSGRSTNVTLRPAHQMSFLEGDDYVKHAEVHGMRDLDDDGLREQLVGGGYPCGPRFQVLDGDGGGAFWQRAEQRTVVCFGRLFPAGVSLGGSVEDVVDWTTNWTCCLFGPSPVSVSVRARNGLTGEQLWETELADLRLATSMSGMPLPDLTADGAPDLLLAADVGFETTSVAIALDGRTGAEIWRAPPTS